MTPTLTAPPKAPVARRLPRISTIHGQTRIDDYAWIREKDDPAVLEHLRAENAYADAVMSPTAALRESLYDELLSHVRQTDAQVPYRRSGDYWYSRTEEGRQYPILARRKRSLDAPEEIVIDVNALAAGREYMAIGDYEPSDDGNLLAYSTDDSGYRQYTLHVKDLRSGSDIATIAENVGSVVWAADGRTLFYTVENEAKRQWRLYRHVVGAAGSDVLLYEEGDELFDVNVSRSRSGAWIFLTSESKLATEVRTLPADDARAELRTIVSREAGIKYFLDHRGERFYILANDTGINYRVVTAPVADPGVENWTELIAHRAPVRIEAIDLFANHLVARERENGLTHLEVLDLRNGTTSRVAFPEPAYAITGAANFEFDSALFRYSYQSLVTPPAVYDYDMDAHTSTLLKRTEVPGYDAAEYVSERVFATADDGTQIPIALVRRRDVDPRGDNPLWLTAYGSYGVSLPDGFSSNRIALLDRGIVYAIAHVRGGGEMGKAWHEAGRMMAKRNTFTDFIACAEHLIDERYTSSSKLIASGGSAGGLLMGVVTNMRPELFRAVIAQVPFVDVINTMLDPTLPLTTQEYVEWGNPNEEAAYRYMESYDPYSNVGEKPYPNLLVRTSLNDSQVGYWEGAKWVAKLRAHATSSNPILLKVNLGAGHGGASGRYDALRDVAFDYAYMLTMWGLG